MHKDFEEKESSKIKLNLKVSYPFIYCKDSLIESLEKSLSHNKKDKIPGNLLSYVDRLNESNETFKYDLKHMNYLKLKIKRQFHEIKIEDMYIEFHDDTIAILNIFYKLIKPKLSELYLINKSLSSIYSKSNNETFISITAANKVKNNINPEKQTFYNPHNNTKQNKVKNDYPFSYNDSHKNCSFFPEYIKEILETKNYYKGRVGFNKEEKEKIKEENENFRVDRFASINPHYLFYENQIKLFKYFENKDEEYFINYDTFITSLILRFVKPNKSYMFYDNFNPLATSYLNSYVAININSSELDEEINNNFISYEPFLNYKSKKGAKIHKNDFFEIYQSQVDTYTIGNTNSIVHLVSNPDMLNIKLNEHYFIYQLTIYQRVKMLNIINSSILNIDFEKNENNIFTKWIRKAYLGFKRMMTMDEQNAVYKKFLTNYNFQVISNSASVDNSYKFFRKCNEIDLLSSQFNTISSKFGKLKDIFEHTFGKVAVVIMFIILIFPYVKTFLSFIFGK
ncbi:hypothetical protein [Halarcobacter sp.]|uniref:hypothetical protein n=1 Tax=Halarcobacter sp. TaxID=2321133 RepID=UPI0029F559FE|nr:hypothetical protein [Halarcobacter sp.]